MPIVGLETTILLDLLSNQLRHRSDIVLSQHYCRFFDPSHNHSSSATFKQARIYHTNLLSSSNWSLDTNICFSVEKTYLAKELSCSNNWFILFIKSDSKWCIHLSKSLYVLQTEEDIINMHLWGGRHYFRSLEGQIPANCPLSTPAHFCTHPKRNSYSLLSIERKQNRSTKGCSVLKRPDTRQVKERLVSTLEHLQVPKWDRTRCTRPEE